MKITSLFFIVLFIALPFHKTKAQEGSLDKKNNSGLHFSLRGGYDFPTYNNNTPFINYKGGLETGFTFDYYWNWIGLGADFDYIKNAPKNNYPSQNLFYLGNPISNFNFQANSITRVFYGIGPSFKFQRNDTFSTELKLRAGYASIKGGRLNLDGLQPNIEPIDLNFHAGYNQKNVFSMKTQLQFNYFINNSLGFHIGAYYIEHFEVPELIDSNTKISSKFRNYYSTIQSSQFINLVDDKRENIRIDPCNCEVHSIGVFAGITYRFKKKSKPIIKIAEEVKPIYSLTVIARDETTHELLPNTEVEIKNEKEEIILKGITNINAEIVFDSIVPGNYLISGILYGIPLDKETTLKNEFVPNQSLCKEILYSDSYFIVRGIVKDTISTLNTVTIGKIQDQKMISNQEGKFILRVEPNSETPIYFKKNDYFSKTEIVSTKFIRRRSSLFIDLEIQLEKEDCGKAIRLKNIHYDLDKYFIRNESKIELNKLALFMTDNPDIKVELSSHTDCRASNQYNATLSQNRANAAVDYLVSRGIKRNRLIGKGYGETKLLNECADNIFCTEPKHQINRRTEMKVICPE